MTRPSTLYERLVNSHTVQSLDPDGWQVLLYVDRTVLNEYTSPQAFTGLRQAGRPVWRPRAALGTVDHVNPTAAARTAEMPDPGAARQATYFAENCKDFGIELFDVLHHLQGIEHVVMPEIGLVLPGMVIGAGDSHTTTYGAFGTLGFGIGTSDIEHYLATQTLKELELRLKSSSFRRIHRNALVNVDHVRKMSALSSQRWLITLNNDQEFVASKRQARTVRELLTW